MGSRWIRPTYICAGDAESGGYERRFINAEQIAIVGLHQCEVNLSWDDEETGERKYLDYDEIEPVVLIGETWWEIGYGFPSRDNDPDSELYREHPTVRLVAALERWLVSGEAGVFDVEEHYPEFVPQNELEKLVHEH